MRKYNWGNNFHAQNVVIVGGTGGVGSELIRQIESYDQPENGHLHPTRILGVTSSTHILLASAEEFSGLQFGDFSQASLRKRINTGRETGGGYKEVVHAIGSLGIPLHDIVVVDMTADKSEDNTEFHRQVIAGYGKIVTANKNPISLSPHTVFEELTNNRDQYAYSASVMAGGPAVREIQAAYDTRNTIKSIEGCFSGTLGYIASELEKGRSIGDIIKDAHTLKYTEPNPWDDLSGLDVARKILILARTAGYNLSMEDITIEPFIPAEYSKYTGEEFFTKVHELDSIYHERMTRLMHTGKTLRYVGALDTAHNFPKITVGLKEVDRSHALGNLTGKDSKVILETRHFTTSYQRPGAGTDNTANSVRADIASLLRGRRA